MQLQTSNVLHFHITCEYPLPNLPSFPVNSSHFVPCRHVNAIHRPSHINRRVFAFSPPPIPGGASFHSSPLVCKSSSSSESPSETSSSPSSSSPSSSDPSPRLKTTKKLTFNYFNAEAALALEKQRFDAREQSLKEYEDLKALLLNRTWRFGTIFSAYLLLAVSGESAFAELVGTAASYGYLLLLYKDVDALNENTPVPLRAVEQTYRPGMMQNIAKIGAAYRQSLTPRLFIPFGLVAACAAWNAALPEEYHLNIVEQGCMLGGFLSYKVALILKVYDDLKPRALTEEEMLQNSRPQLPEMEDVDLNLKRPSDLLREEGEKEGGKEEQGEGGDE